VLRVSFICAFIALAVKLKTRDYAHQALVDQSAVLRVGVVTSAPIKRTSIFGLLCPFPSHIIDPSGLSGATQINFPHHESSIDSRMQSNFNDQDNVSVEVCMAATMQYKEWTGTKTWSLDYIPLFTVEETGIPYLRRMLRNL
jgi:hypothetical protein